MTALRAIKADEREAFADVTVSVVGER